RSSGGYLLDEPPDMTPSFPRTGVSGHAGAVQVELAQRSGTPAYLIDGPDDIEPEWLSSVSTIGVTAGASAPPRLVGQVIDALRGYASITVVERSIATETVRFGLPKQVRAQ
ncbi:4-hydroxy-3-methylbut-2-enyl diphosphate reductase 2, partial [Mycobacterium tuberculosis SK-E]